MGKHPILFRLGIFFFLEKCWKTHKNFVLLGVLNYSFKINFWQLSEIQLQVNTSVFPHGCESSSFQLISSFLTICLSQNFSFFYFQPIFDIFTKFHTVFPCFLSVCSHTPVPSMSVNQEWTISLLTNVHEFCI